MAARCRACVRSAHGFGKTEIEQLHDAIRCDLDVGWFEVAMNHSALMRILQRLRDLLRVVERRLDRQRSGKRFAFHQLHCQRALLDAIDMRNVGVIQRCKDFGFPLETIHSSGIAGKHFGQYLERNLAFQFRIVGAIDFAHTTFAEFRGDTVVPDGLAYHFLSPASQFSTTFKSAADGELPAMVLSKKRFPSAVTSYSGPPGAKCASNSGWGASGSKVGFGPAVTLTAAAI